MKYYEENIYARLTTESKSALQLERIYSFLRGEFDSIEKETVLSSFEQAGLTTDLESMRDEERDELELMVSLAVQGFQCAYEVDITEREHATTRLKKHYAESSSLYDKEETMSFIEEYMSILFPSDEELSQTYAELNSIEYLIREKSYHTGDPETLSVSNLRRVKLYALFERYETYKDKELVRKIAIITSLAFLNEIHWSNNENRREQLIEEYREVFSPIPYRFCNPVERYVSDEIFKIENGEAAGIIDSARRKVIKSQPDPLSQEPSTYTGIGGRIRDIENSLDIHSGQASRQEWLRIGKPPMLRVKGLFSTYEKMKRLYPEYIYEILQNLTPANMGSVYCKIKQWLNSLAEGDTIDLSKNDNYLINAVLEIAEQSTGEFNPKISSTDSEAWKHFIQLLPFKDLIAIKIGRNNNQPAQERSELLEKVLSCNGMSIVTRSKSISPDPCSDSEQLAYDPLFYYADSYIALHPEFGLIEIEVSNNLQRKTILGGIRYAFSRKSYHPPGALVIGSAANFNSGRGEWVYSYFDASSTGQGQQNLDICSNLFGAVPLLTLHETANNTIQPVSIIDIVKYVEISPLYRAGIPISIDLGNHTLDWSDIYMYYYIDFLDNTRKKELVNKIIGPFQNHVESKYQNKNNPNSKRLLNKLSVYIYMKLRDIAEETQGVQWTTRVQQFLEELYGEVESEDSSNLHKKVNGYFSKMEVSIKETHQGIKAFLGQ